MSFRRPSLSPGWYPRGGNEISLLVNGWDLSRTEAVARAVIAPHAGWYFSGGVAALAWASLAEAETVVVIGGHLSSTSPVLIAPEEGFETPFGSVSADTELLEVLRAALSAASVRTGPDRGVDNSVEVQLPFLGVFAKKARLVWLRAPASADALVLGKAIHETASSLGRRVAVVGSTDLTHYGPDYDFEPMGAGPAAERWVREVNDRAFIDALVAKDPAGAIRLALEDGSACSPGAAAAALAFALAEGAESVEELEHTTSLAVRAAPSFVGYAALAAR